MPDIFYLLIFPAVGALIGWFTNWLAILMLFRPRKPVSILGFKLQGVIPRRHADLAERVAETVEQNLLTRQDLQTAMSGISWKEELESLVTKVLHDKGPGSIIGKVPGIADMWLKVIMPGLREVLVTEIGRLINRYRDRFIAKLHGSVDIKEIVRSKVEQFEVEALENIVRTIASKEFVHIQVVGALTGAAIGVVQGLLVLMLG
jgi:uncharacterized membrane protein YheB (UPF0754 family)